MKKQELIVKFVEKIKKTERLDTELAHIEDDEILCELLRELGYGKVVDEYKKKSKWYA